MPVVRIRIIQEKSGKVLKYLHKAKKTKGYTALKNSTLYQI